MPENTYVADRCSEITDRLQYASVKSEADSNLGAYLAEYICVLIAGVVEDCVEHLVIERARKANDTEVLSFVESSIKLQFRNPRPSVISGVLAKFNSNFKSRFSESVSVEALDALDSIVSNRMSLAHRGTPKSVVTVNDVSRYFEQIVEILDAVEQILLSNDQS